MDGAIISRFPRLTTRPGIRTLRMRLGYCFAFILMLTGSISSAMGEEPYIAFVDGLRNRAYFDTAVEYIQAMRLQGDLPSQVRDVLDLELGLTLQQKGASSRVPEDRDQAFAESEAALRRFLAEKPEHPQAALANSMLGEILFERARSLTWKAAEMEAGSEKQSLQQTARAFIDQAKGIYQAAQDLYKVQYEAFPKFVDEAKDEAEYKRRQEAEARYLRAWFNLVRCTYERGQTFDKGSPERAETLTQAADLFEKIHTSRRTNQIGLHARLMMGKCFQEQDDLGRALGIYNEMLDHKSQNSAVQILKGIARHYRMICLNDPQKADHQLVIQEAVAWLGENRGLSTTQYGLGILWEKAIAEEKLAGQRELPEKDKLNILQAAYNDAEQVRKYPGAYREPALAMSRRLKVLLGEKDREPRDFSTAFERARGMISQIQQLSAEIEGAADENDRQLKQSTLNNHLNEVGRLLQLALDLKEGDSDPKAVAQARYLLSFVLLRQGKTLDAIILAKYSLENDQKSDPDTALNSSEIAMAASVAAWNAAPAKDRDFETRMLRDVCLKIVELYPQSSRGGEARVRLGSVYRNLNQPLEAAKWFLEVPATDPQYSSSKISAGQAYWAAWLGKAALAQASSETEANQDPELAAWKAEARKLLVEGIQLTKQALGENAVPSDELIGAEVSLASILNMDGDFAGTITLLTDGGENSVASQIEVEDPASRPADGVRSKSFASQTYRLLLRAFVGTQQIDLALQTMTRLERVGGEDIIAAYTQLGVELQGELKRLTQSGETQRLADVRNSFEKFLQKVYESRNKTDYNSLIWIGETYYGLGQGISGDSAGAESYFSRAADAYSEILAGGLATAENLAAVQLRLARCRRQQKQYEEALKIVSQLLEKNAMMLDAQFEAANILTDWGETSDPAKFSEAIQGVRDATGKPTNVWGWTQLARRLQTFAAKDPSGELRSRFLDARFELTNTRRRLANRSPDDAVKHRKSAMAEILSFVQVVRDIDDPTFARFDRLYQDLQSDLGIPPENRSALEKNPVQAAPEEPEPTAVAASSPEKAAPETVVKTPAVAESEGLLLPILGVTLCAAAAGGFVVFLRKPRKKVRMPGPTAAPKFSSFATAPDSAPGIPAGLNFETPSAPDFTSLGAIGGVRKPTAGTSAARPAQRPVAGAPAVPPGSAAPVKRPAALVDAGAASAATPAPRPRPRPPATDSGSGTGTAAPAKPASEARAVPKPDAATRPATASQSAPGQTAAAPPISGEADPGAVQPRPAASRPAAPRPAAHGPGDNVTGGPARAAGTGDALAKPLTPKAPIPKPAAPRPPSSGDPPETSSGGRPPRPSTDGPPQPRPAQPRPPQSPGRPEAPDSGQ